MEHFCFFSDPMDVGNLICGSSAFSKSSMNIWMFSVQVLLKPHFNFEHFFASVWEECNFVVVWTFFAIAFLWDWNGNWPFPFCCHCWVFQVCRHIECSILTASSFRIWNSATGIPLVPLSLFVVMLSKALHLTLHSRVSGSRWVIRLSWLPGSLRSFLHSSVYSCQLFLVFSASLKSIVHIFAWNVPLVSLLFLRKSPVFPVLLFSSVSLHFHWGRLSYLSLLVFGILLSEEYIFPFLLCHSLLFFSQLMYDLLRQPFCLFPFLFLGESLHHSLLNNVTNFIHSSSGTLSIKSNPLNLFVTSSVGDFV